MAMSSRTLKARVALLLPSRTEALITYASAVHDHMNNNPYFTQPPLTMAVLAADVQVLRDAHTLAAGRAKGAAAARDVAQAKVADDLRILGGYVQQVANAQPTWFAAVRCIESAFMQVARRASRTKHALRADQGPRSGSASLVAAAVHHTAVYFWEYSLDQVTWTSAPETMTSDTVIDGLTPGKVYYFRFRATTRKERIGYSGMASLMVT
jgi:hypothetical protein